MNPILGTFLIAGTTVIVTGCTDDEKSSTASIFQSLSINDPVTASAVKREAVQAGEVKAAAVEIKPCDPGALWRLMYCDDGGNFVPIR